MTQPWRGFLPGKWNQEINVRDFILKNLTPYEGDASFLAGATERTLKLWEQVKVLMAEERKKEVLDADTSVVSTITSHAAGYIDQSLELVVGLQTEKPLKRGILPFGGLRMVEGGLKAYGYTIDPKVSEVFTHFRKTHNEGVFEAYTEEMRRARNSHIITGLPDAYGRGRIIGDYRRVALYGVDRLIEDKKREKHELEVANSSVYDFQQREELSEQIKALNELKEMGATYGCDLARAALNFREAVQWTYLAYLAAIKEQNGAAMSLGRVSTFLDIYAERDLAEGALTESEAQEIMDHFVMKLRMVRFLRTPDYNALFSGDPVWVTESIGGMAHDGRTMVTKSSFRILHTLYNLGAAPEPNLTVLWTPRLPEGFKAFCAKASIDTSSIQYENDCLMRPRWGDDYGIACCVSAMAIGKQMQFFGARANLGKALLYAINGGRDEITGMQVAPAFAPIMDDVLDYETVLARFDATMDWLAKLYVETLNVIHYMHDKYCYERIEMALHDRDILRTMACGIAGLSVVADSLSAIKHAKVKVVRDASGLAVDYVVEGEYPAFGNNDDRVDEIAVDIVRRFIRKLRNQKTYRNSMHTLSVLTITSNVVYGKHTGNTPCGRKHGEPYAPGANPMHNRDKKGAIASMASVAKLRYDDAEDGISYTFSIVPGALGKTEDERVANMVELMDAYFLQDGHHINVNVLDRETLERAMEHPEEFPQLTVRVSGYAVNFVKLTREQQLDVLNRTFHARS